MDGQSGAGMIAGDFLLLLFVGVALYLAFSGVVALVARRSPRTGQSFTRVQDVARRQQRPAFSRNDLLALIDLNEKTKVEFATILKASDALPDGSPSGRAG